MCELDPHVEGRVGLKVLLAASNVISSKSLSLLLAR